MADQVCPECGGNIGDHPFEKEGVIYCSDLCTAVDLSEEWVFTKFLNWLDGLAPRDTQEASHTSVVVQEAADTSWCFR